MMVFYIILTRSFDAFWCDALALSLKNGDRLTTDAERTRPRTKKKKFFCSHSHTDDARVSSFSQTQTNLSHTAQHKKEGSVQI